MAYILGLILVLGLIFSATTGMNLTNGLWHKATDKFKEFTFPKTQKEITIDNLETQYSELDKFFSSVAPSLLNSDAVSAQDKESLKRAVQTFGESQNTIEQLKKLEKEGKSVTKALIEKVFDLNTEPGPEPTSIPPNCNLVCGD